MRHMYTASIPTGMKQTFHHPKPFQTHFSFFVSQEFHKRCKSSKKPGHQLKKFLSPHFPQCLFWLTWFKMVARPLKPAPSNSISTFQNKLDIYKTLAITHEGFGA